jgi:WS/DGAT/MGAT family acyltransferase
MESMERLTGIDAGFLYMETPSQHMHTLKVAVLDPSTVPGGYSFERVAEVLGERLHLLPAFRRRVVEVPLRLHHPVWVEDAGFDLDAHLHRVVLAAPGDHEQLDDLMSDIVSRPLDRDRPLWELTVVEGLEQGHVAFVAKIHHCLADGVRAAELLVTVLDPAGGEPTVRPPDVPWRGEPMPSRGRLVVDALLDLARQVASLPGLLVRTARGLRAAVRTRRDRDVAPPVPFTTPNLRFNTALTPRRRYVTTSVSLPEVKAVKDALGVTVNDVVLALCAGALRSYLAEHGELPDRALMAGVPVSTRNTDGGRDPSRSANNVSNLFTSLPVQLADPVARIQEIHETTRGAKEQLNALGADMLADWSELTPPVPFAAVVHLYSRLGLARHHRPPINLVVSNVPGPTEPLTIAGARLVAIYSMGPILENIGLNVTVWSYLDALNFGIVACDEQMPDLRALADHVHDALAELRHAAGTTSTAGTAVGTVAPDARGGAA